MAQRFAGVGWETPRLLRAMRSSPDFFFDSMGQVRLDHWTRGRVALLGDAGYCATPLTGLGTSLALVGAYVLAGELAASGGDHRIAFRRYDEVMRPYVRQAQQLPPGGASGFAPSGRLGIRLRDLSMRQMTRRPMRKLLAAQFAKAGDIALPKPSSRSATAPPLRHPPPSSSTRPKASRATSTPAPASALHTPNS